MSGKGGRRGFLVIGLALALIGAGVVAVGYGVVRLRWQIPQVEQVDSPTPEPLIPTATETVSEATERQAATKPPAGSGMATVEPTSTMEVASTPRSPDPAPNPTQPKATEAPTEGPQVTSTPPSGPIQVPSSGLFPLRQRVGVVAPMADIDRYAVAQLGAGWYVTGLTELEPQKPDGMDFAQLVPVLGAEPQVAPDRLQEIARQNPGALWLVGNEPDVIWQDDSSPREYARVYRDVYSIVKGVDSNAQIAIGGIAQVTPLRLRYLDAVLVAYEELYDQPMPVDVWNIHLAILREERGSWGVDIPPGFNEDAGILYEIEDNADVEILKEQVVTFRRWMAERGLREKPLIVTEFSVLMPAEYGFPPERVRGFMLAAFDLLVSATDGRFGYPADENRLVQRWAWYSVADRVYSTGNLFDPETGQITPLGRAFGEYVAGQ